MMRTLAEYPPEGWEADLLSSHVVGSPWAKWRAYRRARRELIRRCHSSTEKPDLVHLHAAADWSWWRKRRFAQVAHRAGIPNIVHIHSGKFDSWLGGPDSQRSKSMRMDLEKQKGHPVVLNQSWKKILEPRIGSVSVINNPVAPFIQPNHSRRHEAHILLMGRNDAVKGHQFAIKVAEEVKKIMPDLQMTLTGISSSSNEWISAVGWITDSEKLQLLQTSSLLLVPSAFEGQPLVILEALTCGLPVLTSDRVMDLPKSVMVAEYQNIDQWVSTVIEMLNAPPKASDLIAEAEFYSVTSITKKWGALYSRMLSMEG